ncbi:MAG: hypothetical protein R2774_11130 [Saprospiraceae bacterium]
MSKIPDAFIDFINSGRTPEPTLFLSTLREGSPTSIRINPSKNIENPQLEIVPWCAWGYYLSERPIFTLDPSFHAGKYYVQEASSMSVYYVLDMILTKMNNPVILDISAAPGGKSTIISSMLKSRNDGILVSNDIISSRAYTLKYNLAKEGNGNTIVTNAHPKSFAKIPSIFDIIVVDAPCSGEGLFRKDPSAMQEWSPENVQMCAARQKDIISDLIGLLKPSGYLVYSTCTYNASENMENIHHFIEKYGLRSIPIQFDKDWHIFEDTENGNFGYQFYPHRTKGEGFFISLLQKPNGNDVQIREHRTSTLLRPLSKRQIEEISTWVQWNADFESLGIDKVDNVHLLPNTCIDIAEKLKLGKVQIIDIGTTIGTFKKDIFIPHHHLALSKNLHTTVQKCELNKSQALQFLKKENLVLDMNMTGWVCMLFEGLPIGWAKFLPNRINNYLPSEYAIKMDIK